MNGGTEIVDRDRIGVPAAIVSKVWPGSDGDATRRATVRRGSGARRASGPAAGDGRVVGEDGGMTICRARPRDVGEGPVHRAGAGDGVVVGEDGDVTTDRARPKDERDGPVHWAEARVWRLSGAEAGASRVSGPVGGAGGTATPAIIGPEKRVEDSKFALWLESAVGMASICPIIPVAGELGVRGKYRRGSG
jgi:hypothetical protein